MNLEFLLLGVYCVSPRGPRNYCAQGMCYRNQESVVFGTPGYISGTFGTNPNLR